MVGFLSLFTETNDYCSISAFNAKSKGGGK